MIHAQFNINMSLKLMILQMLGVMDLNSIEMCMRAMIRSEGNEISCD